MFRSILIVSLLLSVTSALNSCSNEPCWEYSDYLQMTETDGEGTSDRGRAITMLLCHMQCQEKDEEFTVCLDNCTATFQLSSQTPSLPPPNIAPVVTRVDDDGLYSITLPDVITYGSGDTGSTELGAFEDELYLIRVSQFENDIFFPAVSLVEEINLTQFACSEVNVSYSVVTSSGDVSKYSPSHTTCVFLPQRGPDAAEHLEITFEEDLDRPQQAIVYITWDSPSDITRLEGYQLLVEYINGDDEDCAEQDNMAYNIEREMTNFTIHPKEGPSPLYSCTYAISLKSLPGNNKVSTDVTFSYGSRPKLNRSCVATYIPKDVKYNLNISWTIVDERALDAIRGYVLSLHTNHPTYRPPQSENVHVKQEDHQTDFTHVYSIKVEIDSVDITVEVRPTRIKPNDEYHWRRPLVPLKNGCDFTIDAVPPEQISSDFIDVDIELIDISSRVLSFTVSWDPPYINGRHLKWYELCVGGDPLTDSTQACESPSDCLYVLGPESSSVPNTAGCSELKLASPDMLVGDVDYHFRRGTEELYIQIRAVNDFDLFGNWSEPILLMDISDSLVNNTTVPGPSDESLVWVYVLAVVAFLLLVAILIVLFICIYRHFCFHRRIKYEHSMQLGEQNGCYPLPIPPPVADEWELQWEDVEVHYNEELGTGAFGMVYRGLLHSRELRDLIDEKRGSSRRSRRGSSGRKSPRQKKLTAHRSMGSCTVAIKRLKENIDGPDKANFLKEIEMMKKVSGTNHDHQKFVVNMLGCVTLQEPMMLVLEYAICGDLLSYLRDSRDESTTVDPKAAPYLEPVGAYSQLTTKREGDTKLTAKDLLSFARQIAAGMEFLASLGVVHRDLACRNILVCEDNLVKISDFGLSRLLVNQEVYVTTTKGVLPIRWMAPEALFYRTFDTQSDVWSFGILLWELYTLGGYPYPTRSNREILELLTTGYRMDKPELCSDEVYEVMLQCWSPLGQYRPTFEALYIQFDSLLGETTKYQTPYVQLLGTYYYDRLTPKHNSNDQELLDLESIPANVDTRRQSQQTTLDPSNVGAHVRSLQEASNGVSRLPGQSYINEARGHPFNQAQQSTQSPPGIASTHRSGSPNRNRTRQTVPDPTRRNENLDSRLSVPLHLSRPRSWVGGTSTELEPRYVTTPLYPNSPRSSTSNLTEETTFSMVNTSSENRLNGSQSRSVGNIPLLTNENLSTNL